MNIIPRLETETDYHETENLTREAFWDLFTPGCVEHLLVHQLRQSPAFVPELDYVACDGEKIVGNIMYSKAVVKNDEGEKTVLCMGPLSVLPEYQKQGIGSILMRATIDRARQLGYPAVVIFGHPDYYHRFGFENAEKYNIQTADGQNFDAFMVLVLDAEAVKGIKGKFHEDGAFAVDPDTLERFDKDFPPREKHKREGQFE